MEAKQHAIVENGVVTNVVIWDGATSSWQPPEGASTVLIDGSQPIGIGYTTADGSTFSPPAEG
ncbi:hypothetical protein [Caballeronia telluris]|uniref:Uncharacterized protein n=1 Tax=Caballeronia telluris TaxID=326475 RepID=A0A158G127_9BURK|nr:hypothetical protein [Caballeronia telluris]SAL25561.1 hypothetical protein AWB66_01467 [Caballeronia telluris]